MPFFKKPQTDEMKAFKADLRKFIEVRAGGNISEATRLLDIGYMNVHRWLAMGKQPSGLAMYEVRKRMEAVEMLSRTRRPRRDRRSGPRPPV